MSVTPVGSSQIQLLANQLLQQIKSNGATTENANSPASLLGDQVTLSPTAQQLSQVPAAVARAMTALTSGQKAAQGDLAQLQGYLQENPKGLATLLGSLQGTASSSSLGSKDALLTALANHQSNGSDPRALLTLLQGTQNQDPLLSALGDSSGGSDGTLSSLFG